MWQPKEREVYRTIRHMSVQYWNAMSQLREELGDAEFLRFCELAKADHEANKQRISRINKAA